MAANELRALLTALRRQYGAQWTLPEPDALLSALTEAGLSEDSLLRLVLALASGEITLTEFNNVTSALFQSRGIDLKLLAAGAAALTLLSSRNVPLESLRQALNEARTRFEGRVTALAEGLAQGRITLDRWQNAMQGEIRVFHLQASLFGNGGLSNENARALAQTKAAQQIKFLDAWAEEIRQGKFPIDAAARLRQRAKLYAGAGEATFEQSYTHSLGLPDLPAYPKDGQTDCRNFCYCKWDIQQVGERDWDCRWLYDPTRDNCTQCPLRAILWNPLRIREGVIQPYVSIGLFRTR